MMACRSTVPARLRVISITALQLRLGPHFEAAEAARTFARFDDRGRVFAADLDVDVWSVRSGTAGGVAGVPVSNRSRMGPSLRRSSPLSGVRPVIRLPFRKVPLPLPRSSR